MINILKAEFICSGFYHNTNQWLCATLAYQNTPITSQFLCNFLYSSNYLRILSRSLLVCHPDISEKLWINLHFPCQITQSCFLLYTRFHYHERSKDSITCCSVTAKNNMSGLLTAKTVSILHHILCHIFISYCSLLIFHTLSLQRFVQTEV